MNTGSETKRAKLRLTVHRGYTGNRPDRLSASLPVRTGVTILSGQVMSIRRNTTTGKNEWSRGYLAGTDQANTFHIAFDDSTDGDVKCAGKLQGLSVRGDYELSSANFKAAETYNAGDELTSDGVTGDLKKATVTGDLVFGQVVKSYLSPVNLAGSYTPKVSDGPVSDGVQGGSFTLARHSNAVDLNIVRWETVPTYKKPA